MSLVVYFYCLNNQQKPNRLKIFHKRQLTVNQEYSVGNNAVQCGKKDDYLLLFCIQSVIR